MTEGPDKRAVRVLDHSKEALALGFPITCATCEYLHRAWDTSAADCGRTQTCGGPLFGKDFPDYKGPIKRNSLPQLCLICGSQDIRLHVVVGTSRFGLCDRHRRVFDKPRGSGTSLPIVVPAGLQVPRPTKT